MRKRYIFPKGRLFQFVPNTKTGWGKRRDKFRKLSGRFRLPYRGIQGKWEPLEFVQRILVSISAGAWGGPKGIWGPVEERLKGARTDNVAIVRAERLRPKQKIPPTV